MSLKSNISKTAMNPMAVLTTVFEGVMPHVKDWNRFLKILNSDLTRWTDPENGWTERHLKLVSMVSAEDEEVESNGRFFTVTSKFEAVFEASINLRTFPKKILTDNRNQILNHSEFLQAMTDILSNHSSMVLLGKLLSQTAAASIANSYGVADELVEGGNLQVFEEACGDIEYKIAGEMKNVQAIASFPSQRLVLTITGLVPVVASEKEMDL